MPSNKTIVTLIICFGVVASVYLLTKNPTNIPFSLQNKNTISANPYINLDKNTNNDWKNILVNIDSSKNPTAILTNEDPDVFEETTLTAQISRDFLSQYLSSIKNGVVTKEESVQIAKNTLSMPGYTTTGAKYIATNLNITTKSNINTLQTYENAVNLILKNSSSQIKENPLIIFRDALNSASDSKMAKLDPIILLNKSLLTDLLSVKVPEKAVVVHLSLLNTSSNILSDLEALRVVFTDPVRSLTAVSQYPGHELDLKTAIENLNIFFIQN